nr:MAG TPA: hypothetical protein [Caudoviricetes sp.]
MILNSPSFLDSRILTAIIPPYCSFGYKIAHTIYCCMLIVI